MIVKFDPQRLQTLDQVREFLAGSRPLDLQPLTWTGRPDCRQRDVTDNR